MQYLNACNYWQFGIGVLLIEGGLGGGHDYCNVKQFAFLVRNVLSLDTFDTTDTVERGGK